MNPIIDIHTHIERPGAIINASPGSFSPKPGLLYSIGIHPWESETATDNDIAMLEHFALHPQVVMIGETGIDKLRGAALAIQIELMQRHIALSEALGKPLVVHCVRLSDELMRLRRSLNPSQPWIFHGFRGGAAHALQLLEAGIVPSYGARHQKEAVAITPVNRLLAETDDQTTLSIEQIIAMLGENHPECPSIVNQIKQNISSLIYT
ncbi:MAG: TatD family hydrolase [Muribaculaceae bacterium]